LYQINRPDGYQVSPADRPGVAFFFWAMVLGCHAIERIFLAALTRQAAMRLASFLVRSGFVVLALSLCVFTSCGDSGIPRVPVRGKITYNGGDWPKPPLFDFAPLQSAEGLPATPASAAVEPNGQFRVDLVPGTYVVNITCWEVEPAPDDPGRAKSYVPKRLETLDAKPRFEVPVGAKEVKFEFDIPKS
jgi:hypothetical protein